MTIIQRASYCLDAAALAGMLSEVDAERTMQAAVANQAQAQFFLDGARGWLPEQQGRGLAIALHVVQP